ncbi:MAG: polymer-forming cytoskeletal protein [Candidatus Cloacimonetes bacterium]|nr:polymer-forming cytoskeletal protein [Candidatus Cloacimonadota bacterium]
MERNKKMELSTMIGKGSVVKGTLNIKGGIRIDGSAEGTVTTDGIILIGTSGYAKANIRCKECLISGNVVGDLYVDGLLELEKSAVIKGNIVARVLIIHSGAKLNGNCSMSEKPTIPDDKAFADSESSQPVENK